jgi:hypothetical protein
MLVCVCVLPLQVIVQTPTNNYTVADQKQLLQDMGDDAGVRVRRNGVCRRAAAAGAHVRMVAAVHVLFMRRCELPTCAVCVFVVCGCRRRCWTTRGAEQTSCCSMVRCRGWRPGASTVSIMPQLVFIAVRS